MTWQPCEREDVQLGDAIRLIVPAVLAIAEGDDGRPAFGYDQTAIRIERWTLDAHDTDIATALADAGIDDHRRGVPLDNFRTVATDAGVELHARVPDEVARSLGLLDRHRHLSLVSDGERVSQPDSQTPPPDRAVPDLGLAPRCSSIDPDEGQCIYVPHGDDVEHFYTMGRVQKPVTP